MPTRRAAKAQASVTGRGPFVFYREDVETPLGRELTRNEFIALDPQKIWDDLTASGACGAPAILFIRDDGTVGLDDANSVYVDESANQVGVAP